MSKGLVNKKAVMQRLINAQKGECIYCNALISLELDRNNHKYATLDHIIPRSLLAVNDERNVVAACRKCNNEKGKQLVYYFYEKICNIHLNINDIVGVFDFYHTPIGTAELKTFLGFHYEVNFQEEVKIIDRKYIAKLTTINKLHNKIHQNRELFRPTAIDYRIHLVKS